MTSSNDRIGLKSLLHVPPRKLIVRFFAWSVLVSLWFLIVYGGADWITRHHQTRFQIAMSWESAIPYVPVSVLAYMSMYGLFLLAPWVLRTIPLIDRFAKSNLVLIAISGAGFLLIPARSSYPVQSVDSWQTWIHIADWINLEHNFVPSLHVGFAVTCATTYTRHTTRTLSWLLWCWVIAVAASTMLLHQHHVVDVVSGWLLAWACVRFWS